MYSLEVLDPVAHAGNEDTEVKPAPRPADLHGVTVGLVWNAKRGGLEALAKAAELIGNKYSDVKVRRYEGSQPCKEELLERAREECDVIVGSTGD